MSGNGKYFGSQLDLSGGFAKADAQTTLPAAKVQANIENIKLLREACHSL